MKKQILAAVFLILIAGVYFAQTAPPDCQSGSPKCYSDLTPYNGHGPASNLPSSLCSSCSGDNRRVVVVRIDSSWGSTTNTNVWNAVNCAINSWNNTTDAFGNKTGYYFVLDQGGATGVSTPDITVKQDTTQSDLGECDVQVNSGSSTRTNNIELSSANGTLGNGSFSASDLCGRIAHEMGHLIGLGNNSLCNTVMRGTQTNGTRLVDSVQPNDVARVNAQFADRDNCGTFTISQDSRAEQTEIPGDVGDPCENNSQCSGNLTCVSGACQGNCDPAGEGWCSAHEGDWIESTRSEERRVGKECRSRWSPYH